jgi:cell division protein FtsB
MAATKRNRYLRDATRRRRHPRRISPALLCLLFVLSVASTLGHVWVRVSVVRQQVKIATLEREVEQLRTSNEYLRVELRDLSGIQQLETAAKSFGFIYPRPENIIRIVPRRDRHDR